MSEADILLHGIRDPRLAVHAMSVMPAWLWSLDGAHILWTNAAGARLFGAPNAAALAERTIGPADQHRRQAAQLAARLVPNAAPRLERLRGFGAPLGRLLTCACARMTLADGTGGLLIAAAEPVARPMPVTERIAGVADGLPVPAMVFTSGGALAGINDSAKKFAALFTDLTGPGFDDARNRALRDGHAMLRMDLGRVAIHRIGSGAETSLVALIETAATPKQMPRPVPTVIAPDQPGEPQNEPPADQIAAVDDVAAAETSADVTHDEHVADIAARDPQDRTLDDAAERPGDETPVDIFESVFDDDPVPEQLAGVTAEPAAPIVAETDRANPPPAAEPPSGSAQDNFPPPEAKTPVDTPQNVVPFPLTDAKTPALTAVESNAFDELARRLSARLEGEADGETAPAATEPVEIARAETPVAETEPPADMETEYPAAAAPHEAAPPRATFAQDSQLLDRLPVGVLIYRLDRLLYANDAFLASTGYTTLHALTEAGGLDALTVEANVAHASSTSETGTPVVISAISESGPDKGQPADARLYAITWEGEPAHALIFSGPRTEPRVEPAPVVTHVAPVAVQSEGLSQAEELAAILDATSEGVVIFDSEGRLQSCNRAAETMFGRNDAEIAALHLTDLVTAESRRGVLDYVESVKAANIASLLDHGRDMQGRARDGSAIPLAMTVGRTRPGGARFFAIFRDISHTRQTESDLAQARRQADRAASAKADILGRISHEVRMPLNAIIGFSDVMIDERFGALGNERYVEYMKDIRASGQRVMAIIDDLLDLSRIESGKMELSFASQDLNTMVEQCVAVMQPQANRERIIIRTSLAHSLPTVKADARALRQIALNLIGNSIHLANAGGQVIVSTATTDFGDIVLRVRDTGPGLNDNEIAAAMAPFRTDASDQTADGAAVNLSLTKALVEANRAQFHIKTAPHSGTLIEVVFSHASAIA